MKKFIKLFLIIFLFMIATPVLADSDKLYTAGETVTETESKNGTSFVAGNDVETSNEVDGISFVAGSEVDVKSTSDYLFTAGYNVTIENASFRDGFIAGYTIELSNSNIERDVYTAADTVRLSTTVGRDMYVAANTLIVTGTVNGNLTAYAANIEIKDGAVINGTLKYSEDAVITISDKATINNKEKVKSLSLSTPSTFTSMVIDALFSFTNALVVGIVLLLLLPKLFEKIVSYNKQSILSSLGIGLGVLFVLPVAAIMLIISMVGISLSMLLLGFFVVAVYLSTLFGSYYVGNLLLGKNITNRYLILLISLFAYYLIRMIPFVGTLMMLVILVLGLGLITRIIFKRK